MPHKHNPVAAISARACARRAPGLVATLLAAMEQEHERAAGAWHSEWPTLTGLLATVGSAAAWLPRASTGCGRTPPGWRRRWPRPATRSWPARWPTRSRRRSVRARRTTRRRRPSARPRRSGRPLPEVLAGAPMSSRGCSPGAPDTGEAGAQVDAVLADHVR